MIRTALSIILACAFIACGVPVDPTIESIESFPVDTSIRALAVVSDQVIWFAGSGGRFGYTTDGGQNWHLDSLIVADTLRPDFRSIAVTNQATYLLCAGSPALLFKSTDLGATWKLMYSEDHPNTFYDGLAFWDDHHGIAVGDPIDSCLSVLLTDDGGELWKKVGCEHLPPSKEGEAAFAASNTTIALVGDHAWLASGGKAARVFHSSDRGMNWEVHATPVVQGEPMTGIFTCDFYDESRGIIMGGDWQNKDQNAGNKSITKDGGRTWELVADGMPPGYRSCVQYVPQTRGRELMAVGDTGISYSVDGGMTWLELSTGSYYTLRISPSGRSFWAAGKNKLSKLNMKRR